MSILKAISLERTRTSFAETPAEYVTLHERLLHLQVHKKKGTKNKKMSDQKP